MYVTPLSGMLYYLNALYRLVLHPEVMLWALLKIATANILLELLDVLTNMFILHFFVFGEYTKSTELFIKGFHGQTKSQILSILII
jgi:hypothetical protein